MKVGKRWRRGLLLANFGALAGCGSEIEAGGADAVGGLAEASPRIINVETSTVRTREFAELINLAGVVMADQDVTISAQESGVIRRILVDKGNSVRSGQILFEIDDQILRSQVLESAAQASLANEIWERRKRLYEEEQVGSELAYLEAKFSAEQAIARLSMLQARLANTVIRAPIDGVLETRMVEIGTMVINGTDVARVVSLDPVRIVAGVPERYAKDVTVGASATVLLEVLDIATESTISYVAATVNAQNRTFLVELQMANPASVIKPEMVANVGLVRKAWEDAIVIPQEALVRVEAGFVVFVVDGMGKNAVAVSRSVEVGPSQEDEVVIEEGLSVGDRLIVVGQQQVVAQDRVNVVGTI